MSVHATLATRVSRDFTLDVNLTIPPGITILFGASGSGKSTILRCLAGLTTPDTGRITFGDIVVFDRDRNLDVPPRRRRAGYVFQQLALFPHLSVAANIGYGLTHLARAERDDRIRAIADSFRIAALLDRRPAQISGGERQRTALARTLVTEPAVLLLDEPLSALDHDIQSRIIDDLRRWNERRRVPILYVTHAHREVYALGERAIVVDRGRVIASGAPHAVLDHPGHSVLAQLAGFENVFTARVLERRDAAGTMHVQLADSSVELEVPLTDLPHDAVRVAIRAGDILVAREHPSGISARNILDGIVEHVGREGPTMVMTVNAGRRFVVHMTPEGAQQLGLQIGARVWLVIKTYSCRLAVQNEALP